MMLLEAVISGMRNPSPFYEKGKWPPNDETFSMSPYSFVRIYELHQSSVLMQSHSLSKQIILRRIRHHSLTVDILGGNHDSRTALLVEFNAIKFPSQEWRRRRFRGTKEMLSQTLLQHLSGSGKIDVEVP